MDIGRRVTELREAKGLSQGDIEKRSGLLRCYLSRVENGHTVPSIETLEKLARSLDMPLYALLYEPNESAPVVDSNGDKDDWTSQLKGQRVFRKFRRALSNMQEADRQLLLQMAQNLSTRKKSKK